MSDIALKEVIEQIAKLGTHLEEAREEIVKEREERNNLHTIISGEVKETEDRIITEMVPKILESQDIANLIKSNDEMKATLTRMNEETREKDIEPDEYHEACLDILANGNGEMRADVPDRGPSEKTIEFFKRPEIIKEQRRLQEDTDWKGGVFVSPQLTAEVLKLANDENPLIPACRNINLTVTNSITFKKRTSLPTAYRMGEGGTGTKSTSKYGDQTISAHNISVLTDATRDILADAPLMESFITQDAGEALGLKMGVEIIDGSSGTGLEGIEINSDIASVTALESTNYTNTLSPGDFAAMYTTLKPKYRGNSTWLFNSTSLGKIMQMSDSQGGFLWQQTLVAGPQSFVLGRPYIICENLSSPADNTKPVFLGDFMRAYFVVNRTPIEVVRDPYSAKPNVEFLFIARSGGAVVTAEAIKKLSIAKS